MAAAKSLLKRGGLETKLAALDGPEWDSSSDEDELSPADAAAIVKGAKKKASVKASRMSFDGRGTKPASDLHALASSSSQALGENSGEDENVAENEDDHRPSSVIYLGHIPPAFAEGELNGFLSQFGAVTNLRLSRSSKTGRPRGYAFIEFSDADVAKVVADTLGGYILGERRLVCHVLERGHVRRAGLFQDGKKKTSMMIGSGGGGGVKARIEARRNRSRSGTGGAGGRGSRTTEEIAGKITKKLKRREKKRRKMLVEKGIEYDFPGFEGRTKEGEGREKEDEGADIVGGHASAKEKGGRRRRQKRRKVGAGGEEMEKSEKKKRTSEKLAERTNDGEEEEEAKVVGVSSAAKKGMRGRSRSKSG